MNIGGDRLMNDYKELEVWKRSMYLAEDIYIAGGKLPKYERFALADQIRRSAVPIPSNPV